MNLDDEYNLLDNQRETYTKFTENEPFNEQLRIPSSRGNLNEIREVNEDEDTMKANQDELVGILMKGDQNNSPSK